MPGVATERLWLTQPRRATALAKVVAVRGDAFAVDRSLFAPTSRAHRHPQPHDTGIVWVDGGDKRVLTSSFVDRGVLWHRLRGTVPKVGAALRCELDGDRRLLASRAHTAMHLLLAAAQGAGRPVHVQEAGAGQAGAVGPSLLADPAVKGGGAFRLEFAAPVAPKAMAAWLEAANRWVAQDHAVAVEHVLRELAPRALDAQRFDPPDPYPGPADVLDVVRIDGVAAYPCDGTHVARTGKVGRIVVEHARGGPGGGGGGRFVLVGRVT